MESLLNQIDTILFYFCNHTLQNIVFDYSMPFITNLSTMRVVQVLVLVLLLWMILRGKSQIRLAAILLIITIAFSDQLSSSVIKFWFDRVRPCRLLPNVHLLVGCGSGYSFPSSHAVNNFAGALILTFFIPRWRWAFWGFATLVAFSRIYVGVHYPFDVLGGAVIGIMCGGLVLTLFLFSEKLWFQFKAKKIKE